MKRWKLGDQAVKRPSRPVQALALALLVSVVALVSGQAAAQQSSSSQYMVNEVQFGAGSSLHDCSDNYCAKTSAGDLVNGRGSSDNYSAQFGFNTSDEPFLEVSTQNINSNAGVLDTDVTGTASYAVKVRNYLSNGYVIQITGSPPKMGSHTMSRITSPSSSHQGAEQFGLNLVANTAPAVGADPVQVPDGTFSFGSVMSDYATPDLFMYNDGDIVAHSTTSSGETDYTVAMILNISNITPGGQYKGAMSAVVTPVF